MSQSRKASIIESLANVAIGYGVATAMQVFVFPLYDIHIPLYDNLAIGGIFTVAGLVRGYVLRRLFNQIRRWF